MFNPWLSFGLRTWQIDLEGQSVIALRMLRLAAGRARSEAESSRMVTEKILAAGEGQVEAAAAMRGHKKHVVAGKALTIASAFAPINADFVADSKVRNLGRLRRYTRVISSEVGGIERRYGCFRAASRNWGSALHQTLAIPPTV
jgi:hypothetical protein